MIRAAAAPRRKKQPEEKPKYTICLPYVSGVGEDLRRVCRKYDIRTAFSTVSTLRQQLTKVKDVDPLLSRAGVVYSIPCSDCEQYYIGETMQEGPGNSSKRTSGKHQTRRDGEIGQSGARLESRPPSRLGRDIHTGTGEE